MRNQANEGYLGIEEELHSAAPQLSIIPLIFNIKLIEQGIKHTYFFLGSRSFVQTKILLPLAGSVSLKSKELIAMASFKSS